MYYFGSPNNVGQDPPLLMRSTKNKLRMEEYERQATYVEQKNG